MNETVEKSKNEADSSDKPTMDRFAQILHYLFHIASLFICIHQTFL